MVTGDYHHTAIAVGKGVGMIASGSQLVIVQAKTELQTTAQSLRPSIFSNASTESARLTAYPVLSKSGGRDPSFDFSGRLWVGRNPGRADSRDPSFDFMGRLWGNREATGSQAILPSTISHTTALPEQHVSGLTPSASHHVSISLSLQQLDEEQSSHQSVQHQSPQPHGSQSLLSPRVSPQHQSIKVGAIYQQPSQHQSSWQHPLQQQLTEQQPSQRQSSWQAPLWHQLPEQQLAHQQQHLPQQLHEQQLLQQPPETSSAVEHLQPDMKAPMQSHGHLLLQQPPETSSALNPMQPDMTGITQSLQQGAQLQADSEPSSGSCEGLVFMLQSEDHVEELDAKQAITNLAQVCLSPAPVTSWTSD